MKLGEPLYLLLILPIAILIFLYLKGFIGREATLRFSNLGLIRSSGVKKFPARRIIIGILRAAALVCLMIALARPQTGRGEREETKFVIDIMISLDTSSSMATLDFTPQNRLVAAKLEAKRFIESRPDDRIGLVIFAKSAVTVCPLTTDKTALLALLDRVEMGMLEDGTAIGVGLATAVNRLRESETKSKVLVLLTDGVNNSGEIDPPTAAKIAKEFGVKVYMIGMGKDGIALVPVNDPRRGPRLEKVLTQIDEEMLRSISGLTGGRYFRAQDEKALRDIFSEIDRLEKTEIKVDEFVRYDEHYPLWLWAALAALLAEFLTAQVILRRIP